MRLTLCTKCCAEKSHRGMHFIPLRLSRRATTLPLFPLREERAGERRHFSKTLSPALSPLVPRGAREKNCIHLTFQLDYGNQVHTSKKLSMFAKILRRQNNQHPTSSDQHPATNIQRPTSSDQHPTSLRPIFGNRLRPVGRQRERHQRHR